MKWWGYVHTSGSIQAKPFMSELDIEEARESPFCQAVYGPFEADERVDALRIVNEKWTIERKK